MTPTATIIIITYNSAATIGACLDAVARLEPRGAFELVVLDNASTDDTVAFVTQRFPAVQLIVESENWGFAGGVNRAVAPTQGAYVLLLNPDAQPEPGWAAALIAALDAPGVGVVGSKIVDPNGRIQSVGTLLDEQALLTAHRGGGEADRGHYDEPADVAAVHGAAIGFSRALWQQLGGFDEGFFPAYWEEVDFCARARRAGQRVVVAPAAVVRHTEASATGKYSAQFYGYYLRNRLRYAAKWRDWDTLWGQFRPAEHARLATAPMLDRRVAKVVYDNGVPELGLPDADARQRVCQFGTDLRSGKLPADGYAALARQLAEAAQNSVHAEVEFQSRIGALASFRRAWNDVATRWYVRPNFDQQTRYNLAVQRALESFAEQEASRAAAQALDAALLAWKVNSK